MTGFLFLTLIYIHLLIHLVAFSKAFGFSTVPFGDRTISRPQGIAWMITALFFAVTGIGFLMQQEWWPVIAIAAVIMSEVMITKMWKEAWTGTIINLVILVIAIISIARNTSSI